MFEKGPEILFSVFFFLSGKPAISNNWNNYTKEVFFPFETNKSKGKYIRNRWQRRDVDGYSFFNTKFYHFTSYKYLLAFAFSI